MTQTKGLKRNTIDKFYTKKEVADLCIQLLKTHIHICDNDLVIEPSAGNGSFIESIKSLKLSLSSFVSHIFFDIEPEHDEIIKQDFLLYDYGDIQRRYNNIHIIGNPPFGRQSSLAIKFIKKSCEFCNTVSFILPKSFKKDKLIKVFPLHFHLLYSYDIPKNSFTLDNNKSYDVPCVFQIWEKRDYNRPQPIIYQPNGFIFVKKTDNPHISVRRVGFYSGKIDDKNIEDKNTQTHYFIKFTNNKPLIFNLSLLSQIEYKFNNSVGPRSISKQELIIYFNSVLDNLIID